MGQKPSFLGGRSTKFSENFRGVKNLCIIFRGGLEHYNLFLGGVYILHPNFGGGVRASRPSTTILRYPPPFWMFMTPSLTRKNDSRGLSFGMRLFPTKLTITQHNFNPNFFWKEGGYQPSLWLNHLKKFQPNIFWSKNFLTQIVFDTKILNQNYLYTKFFNETKKNLTSNHFDLN